MSLCLLITGGSFEQSASDNMSAIFFSFLKNNRSIGDVLLVAVERGGGEKWKNVEKISHTM